MRSGRCTAWARSTASNAAAAEAAIAALKHPSAGVRRNAVQVLPRDARSAERGRRPPDSLRDPDAQVRLAAFLAWPISRRRTRPPRRSPRRFAAGLAASDHWLADAATAAAAQNDAAFLKAIAAAPGGRPAGADRCSRIVERVAEHWAAAARSTRPAGLLARSAGGEPPSTRRSSAAWPAAGPRTSPRRLDTDRRSALKQLAIELPAGRAAQLVRLVEPVGQPGARRHRRRDRRRRCWRSAQDESARRVAPARRRAAAHRAACHRRRRRAQAART